MPFYLIWRTEVRERLDGHGEDYLGSCKIYRQRRTFSSREAAERHARRALLGPLWYAVIEGDTFEAAERAHNLAIQPSVRQARHFAPDCGWQRWPGLRAALRSRFGLLRE